MRRPTRATRRFGSTALAIAANPSDRPQATGHKPQSTRRLPQVRLTIMWVLLAGVVLAFSACASMNLNENGAVIGAASGGGEVGDGVGRNSESTARGSIIEAAIFSGATR